LSTKVRINGSDSAQDKVDDEKTIVEAPGGKHYTEKKERG